MEPVDAGSSVHLTTYNSLCFPVTNDFLYNVGVFLTNWLKWSNEIPRCSESPIAVVVFLLRTKYLKANIPNTITIDNAHNVHIYYVVAWRRHQMETFSASLAICAGNSPVHGEFPSERPVARSFDVFLDLRPNIRLSKQSWGWWFDTPFSPLWRHCDGLPEKVEAYHAGCPDMEEMPCWHCGGHLNPVI